MRIERVSNQKFKIFLTFDDLMDRGLTRDELWKDLPRVHRIFSDMMFEASSEIGVELNGVLLVQVYLLQAQGMLVIVTKSEFEDYEDEEDYLEMKVTLDESREMIFSFDEFEDVIQAVDHLNLLNVCGGDLYHYHEGYYMLLLEDDISHLEEEQVIALMSEFASASAVTSHRLEEYGKSIAKRTAVVTIHHYFGQHQEELKDES
ncbi:genetic competence negative regulator [Thalassobacillus sp. CUG 92003]|uniref:genetic competence negative regulator n=1 Tax=Thalassobacillus sp. CUG 92003 TaxID=2736641 RepID=UPI0015E716C4|nr:genetic competence negative regulator [Thalassobacillus sp. CUG 92003]